MALGNVCYRGNSGHVGTRDSADLYDLSVMAIHRKPACLIGWLDGAFDPDVWSGRAEQEDFDKLVVSGLA